VRDDPVLHLAWAGVGQVQTARVCSEPQDRFVGLGSGPDAIHADSILAVDTSTWTKTAVVATQRYSAFVVSADGKRIFTVDDEAKAVDQVALDPFTDLGSLGTVADRPQAIYTAP
jgi:hypothetical protein